MTATARENLVRQLPPASPCRVCGADQVIPFELGGTDDAGLGYWRCSACLATFLDAARLPSRAIERERYRLHQNHPADLNYRNFLAKLTTPLLARLPPRQTGLDYGCGPGPALAEMLQEAGHSVHLYDPFFHPDATAFERTYDFITCSEVAEHFHRPHDEFLRLHQLLRPNGWLALMTTFQTDDARFFNWHYRRDPTHVTFYRAATFHCLAAQFGWTCHIPCSNVVLMQKPPAAQ